MRRSFRPLALLAFALMAFDARGQDAAREVTSAALIIQAAPELTQRPAAAAQWKSACANLAKALGSGGGPWGFGPFAPVTCDKPPDEFGREPNAILWRMTVASNGKEGELKLALAQDGVADSEVALELGKALEPLDLLGNAELARRIAGTFIDGLPMAFSVKSLTPTKSAKDKGKSPPTLILKYPALADDDLEDAGAPPPPPKALTLYTLRWDQGANLWRPRIVTSVKLKSVTLPKPGEDTVGRAVYTGNQTLIDALKAGPLWAQDGRGAGANDKAWRQALQSAQASLASAQEDRLSSPLVASAADLLGYVGLRFGKQILVGNKLLEATNFFGLLAELRAGPLSGLQYYYDILPSTKHKETTVTDQEVESSIKWSRHVLGYTFRKPFPFLIDRMTLTPKLGIWNLEANIPGPPDDNGRVDEMREFSIKNAISVGGEMGGELIVSRFLLRPWGGIDSGYSPIGKAKRVTSRRLGLDVYMAGPSFGLLGATVRFAMLGFLFAENVSLTTEDVTGGHDEPGADGVKRTIARRIEYNAGYAGLGLALSW